MAQEKIEKNRTARDGGSGQLDDGETNRSLHPQPRTDPARALQSFLDRIPISSLPGMKSTGRVLELRSDHTVNEAIRSLYANGVSSALIADATSSDTASRFSDRYIGVVDLGSLVLWSLEEFEKDNKARPVKEGGDAGFFSVLDRNPRVGQTKVSELAKSFLWDPFLPVRLEDSLFHVLLLFSKHQLLVLPVVDGSESQVVDFIAQDAVIELLLQSSGLEWFDNISDQAISEHRFNNEDCVVYVYGDRTVAEALHTLRRNHWSSIAVLDRKTERLVGCIRSGNLHLLLDNDGVFHNREKMTVEDFIQMEPTRNKTGFIPRMDSPITSRKTDSLKHAMKKLAEAKYGSSCFLVDDESGSLSGVISSRDVIGQFVPPSPDLSFRGAHGLFGSALEQTGCHVEDGQLVRDK